MRTLPLNNRLCWNVPSGKRKSGEGAGGVHAGPPCCGTANTTPYECDGLTAYRQRPLVVALPETVAQVQELRTCFAMDVPVVAQGAGWLSGGPCRISGASRCLWPSSTRF